MNLCVYDPATGEILRSITCPAEIAELQAGPGEAALEGLGDDSTHYVADGALVAYTDAERARKAARPSRQAQWSNATRDWIDLRTLEQRKAARLDELRAARDAAMVAPLETPFGTFDADPESRQNIADRVAAQNALARRGQPSTRPFTLADNSVVQLTADQMEQVGLLLADQVDAAHVVWRGLRAAVDAATTPAEVDAVTWPA